ncbi:hypothetical protein F4779DRAFT_602210 [Xylariaceae sp. FL0662B]|nr:hypothetical protein F4779DRAFT_602210 [Xylariaceae sp. FL0662B]
MSFIDCRFHGQDPDNGVTARYCVCSGSTFPASTTTANPGNSCAYTSLPDHATSILTIQEVFTSNCHVCVYEGENAQCSKIQGCTPTSTVASTPTHTTVTVTPTADCVFWDEVWGWRFEIFNIAYWATDGGRKLQDEENGCGDLTGWDWHSATSSSYPRAYFNIDFFIKAGCIERAVVSAGGPKISCNGKGVGIKKRSLELNSTAKDGEALRSPSERLRRAAVPVTASYLPPSSTPKYTYPASVTSTPAYVPMIWTGAYREPVVLTSTLTSEKVGAFINLTPTTPSITGQPR